MAVRDFCQYLLFVEHGLCLMLLITLTCCLMNHSVMILELSLQIIYFHRLTSQKLLQMLIDGQ